MALNNFAKRLRKLRIAHGFSIDQVSNYLGKDYSKIETGYKTLHMHVVEELADLYNCSEEYILCENDDYDFSRIPKGIESFDLNVLSQMNGTMRYLKILHILDD